MTDKEALQRAANVCERRGIEWRAAEDDGEAEKWYALARHLREIAGRIEQDVKDAERFRFAVNKKLLDSCWSVQSTEWSAEAIVRDLDEQMLEALTLNESKK